MTKLAAYNFDEVSGDVLDISGNGRSFSLTAPNIRTNLGRTNKGLTQSGSDVLLLPGTILNSLKTPNRTLAAWIQEASPVTGWVGEFHVSSIGSGSWGILFLSGQWNFQARNASEFVRCSVARPTDSLFHHFAGTYDGANVRCYLDSVLVSTQTLASPLRTDADELRLLNNTSSSVIIDDVQYFDEALTQPAIATLMNTPLLPGRSGMPKVKDSLGWNPHQAKMWNGSSWDEVRMYGHNGTGWISSR